METEILKGFFDNVDWIFLIQINIVSYVCIKLIDDANGDKIVPSWLKTTITFIAAIVINMFEPSDADKFITTVILSLISWDYIFKPVINKLDSNLLYKKK